MKYCEIYNLLLLPQNLRYVYLMGETKSVSCITPGNSYL